MGYLKAQNKENTRSWVHWLYSLNIYLPICQALYEEREYTMKALVATNVSLGTLVRAEFETTPFPQACPQNS